MNLSSRRSQQPKPAARKSHRIGFWWFAYVAFVIYGSLVPLQFTPLPWNDAWTTFQQIRLLNVGTGGRADWVANGVLYVPVGFLTAMLLSGQRRGAVRFAASLGAMVFVAALAVSIEFVQLAFPPRTVSLNDLLAELVGGGLGAILAGVASDRFRELWAAMTGAADRLLPRLLEGYALAYCAFSLFPYDFLLSATELADKLDSGRWGWVWAAGSGRGTGTAAAAKIAAEALAAAPLGLLLAGWGKSTRQAWRFGLALGIGIEFAQFFLVSGVSQGFSVLTRALGITAGALAWHRRHRFDPLRLAAAIRHSGWLLATLYILSLAAVTGWFELEWQGLEAAAASLREVRFLPFYYYYYTTEQVALLSLVSIGLVYGPLGIVAWANFMGPRAAASMAMFAAAVVESSKLFLVGLHPDPTNVLLAGIPAWLAYCLSRGTARLSLSRSVRKMHFDNRTS